MKNKNQMKKAGCIILILLIFCISHVFAEPCGDVNSDGSIDIVDALLVAQYFVNLDPVNFDEVAADVNNDGMVDIVDALLIAQFYVGLIPALPGCEETTTPTPGPTPDPTPVPVCFDAGPPGYTCCANEGDSVTFEVEVNVAYGADESFNFLYNVTGTITFDNDTFGDPIYGVVKHGFFMETGTPTPTPVPTETPEPTPTWDPNNPNPIGLYRTYEHRLINNNNYNNKFTDVELTVRYTSPSNKTIDFYGFYDGDGEGGGDVDTGNVWKMRFMPDELGPWSYTWTWSDGTPGGSGIFTAVPQNAGKGILRAYAENPRWMAYNGTEPVFIKSYYESGHGAIAQPFDWIKTYVYQPMLDRGYNHLQVNWLLPLCCEVQYYHDGPPQSISSIRLYDNGKASSTMRLNIWHMMEEHVQWLNDRNVGLHMFLGFNGGRNGGPDYKDLSSAEKEFYVKYVVARLAPYACIAGWNYCWEISGSDAGGELGLARLLEEYDIFEHLRTYEDAHPEDHEWDRPEYTFAATENHGVSPVEDHKEGWSHHVACLVSYVPGKPVYMSEGNGLWRRYWQARTGATRDNLRQSAWGCTTAAASFCWNGHKSENNLEAFGPDGLPFNNPENAYTESEDHIEILTRCMNDEVVFYHMTPQDSLLSGHDSEAVWCLAKTGQQYLVFALGGKSFNLNVASGQYNDNIWLDAKTGDTQSAGSVNGGGSKSFTPPNTSTDWVLILRS